MPKSRPKPSPPSKPGPAAPATRRFSRVDLWISLGLLAVTFALYASVRHFDFVNFDDPEYVGSNPHVRQGVTWAGIVWAFTSTEAANWFPLTRVSHMWDVQWFGLASGWHHLTNVFLHAFATVFLYLFLRRATDTRWPSGWVAFVFALHPLHVESVAWIAERKDVLCAFFWFLTLLLYVLYVERPGRGRYTLVLGAFALGLMSKPMIVTLPVLLLLLDFWPLRRAGTWIHLLREKIPFFALSAASAIATFVVQRSAGAIEAAPASFAMRVGNAIDSYIVYLVKMFWPVHLAVFYPFPPEVPIWQPVAATFLIAAITLAVIRFRRDLPYLAVGWLWYLATLLPVIGVIQVGAQAHADRYMYVPMIGVLIMVAWGVSDLVHRRPARRPVSMALTAITTLACIPVAWAQIQTWQNSESLFQHALDVTDRNYVAHHNLGVVLSTQPGRLPDAIAHYEASLAINPDSARTRTDFGNALAATGRLPEAVAQFDAALKISPGSAIPHNNLGSALAKSGRVSEAIAQFQEALRIDPDYAEAHANLAGALSNLPGRMPEAIAEYRTALRLDPDSAEAHNGLGSALMQSSAQAAEAIPEFEAAVRLKPDYAEAHANLAGALVEVPSRINEALGEYQTALRLDPNSAEAHYNFGVALSKIEGRTNDAITQYEAALRIKPDYAEAHSNLGVALSSQPGRMPEAISHFETALRLRPDYADAHYNLGVALSNIPGRMPEAIAQFETALRLRPDPELQELLNRLRSGR